MTSIYDDAQKKLTAARTFVIDNSKFAGKLLSIAWAASVFLTKGSKAKSNLVAACDRTYWKAAGAASDAGDQTPALGQCSFEMPLRPRLQGHGWLKKATGCLSREPGMASRRRLALSESGFFQLHHGPSSSNSGRFTFPPAQSHII